LGGGISGESALHEGVVSQCPNACGHLFGGDGFESPHGRTICAIAGDLDNFSTPELTGLRIFGIIAGFALKT
jgi:hypothetical protein